MKEIKKEEIENLSYKDITFMILEREKKGINTLDLFTKIVSILELPPATIENKIGDYYTSLTTDKRFVLVDGVWDLRKRYTSDKVIVDSLEDEDLEEDEEELKEDDDMMLEDTYDDEYTDDTSLEDDFDTEEDEDLSDLVVLDEEDLN